MHLLVLGGTQFLGRAVVADAMARGHHVTLFTRGRTNPGLFPDAEHVRGDRTETLAPLDGRSFDAVVDTSGYHPRPVAVATARFRDTLYCFVSSISVYADLSKPGIDERSPTATIEGPVPDRFVPELYGALKALCEREVAAVAPRASIVRPGLIVGPHDPTDRFTYWPVRAARGGVVLAPGRPARPVQLVDVRDLASWMVDAIERGLTGTYNAASPRDVWTMEGVVEAARSAAGQPSTVRWVPENVLLEHAVEPWTDIPLWLPEEGSHAGMLRVDCSAAAREGLACRPLEATARDTLSWFRRERGDALRTGLGAARERDLLSAYGGGAG